MHIDQIRDEFAKLETEIADGPIVPNVTAEEIRAHLESRYDVQADRCRSKKWSADVEQMLRKWQVQVTHPRYFGLYNPSVTLARWLRRRSWPCTTRNWPTGALRRRQTRLSGTRWRGWPHKFGLPEDSIATFTSGGMEANLSAVVVALT